MFSVISYIDSIKIFLAMKFLNSMNFMLICNHGLDERFLFLFLVLLILVSQRIEDVIGWELSSSSNATKRGAPPSLVESFILAWVAGRELDT